MIKQKMIGHISAVICLINFFVFTALGAEVYLIDANSKNGNVHRLTLSIDKKSMVLDPISSDDSRKLEADHVYEVYSYPDNNQLKLSKKQNRLFGNMFGSPSHLKSYATKKYRSQRFDLKKQMENLEPIIKYLLSHKSSNIKNTFQDLTRKEKKPFAEDYVDFGDFGRLQAEPDFSQDYVDFRMMRSLPRVNRLRRATDIVKKKALRSYGDSDDDDDDDEEDEDSKSKRFEVVKNKHNKKDIKNDSDDDDDASDDNDYKETKKVKGSKVEELDSDEEFSEFSDKETKSKKSVRQSKKKKQLDDDEGKDDVENVELYLQGNKLTMYPPINGDSVESSEETRKNAYRRLRMPHFLPRRIHRTERDLPNLGYFFFNGPKGISLETE